MLAVSKASSLGDLRATRFAALVGCVMALQVASVAASVWPPGSIVMIRGGKDLVAYSTKGKLLPGSVDLLAAERGLSSLRKGAISPDGKYAFNMASTKTKSGPLEKLIVTAIGSKSSKVVDVVSLSLSSICASGNPLPAEAQLDVAVGKAFANGSYPVATYFTCDLSASTYGKGCAGTYLSLCNYKPGGKYGPCPSQGLNFDFSCTKSSSGVRNVAVPYNINYYDGHFYLSGYYGTIGKFPNAWQLVRATGSFPYTLETAATLRPWGTCPGVTAIQSAGTAGSKQNAAFYESCFESEQPLRYVSGDNKVSTFLKPASGRKFGGVATLSPGSPLVVLDCAVNGKSASKVRVMDKASRKTIHSFEVAADFQHPIIMP